MKARALSDILSLPTTSRFELVSEGLELLVEHVSTLLESIDTLTSQGQDRAAAIIASVATEESAKALILADLARLGWVDQKAARRQIKYFYQHVPRGIYAEMVSMRPADLREVQTLVDLFRPSRFLDGPEYFEWIFRNRVEQAREESIYVDLVADEIGPRWVSPAQSNRASLAPEPAAAKLILAMARLGIFTPAGLDATCTVWRGARIDDNTPWTEVARLNRQVLEVADEAGAFSVEATPTDVSKVTNEWGFPLHGLDLTRKEVTDEELATERRNFKSQFNADEFGDDYGEYE